MVSSWELRKPTYDTVAMLYVFVHSYIHCNFY